ncbi:MAG: hypothetical protein RLZZ170_1734, partial [Actinomycetota bacterium]
GADDEIRTRDPHLGKVMLYQLSHIRRVDEVYLPNCHQQPVKRRVQGAVQGFGDPKHFPPTHRSPKLRQ